MAVAAAKAGMSEKTARRYRDLEKLPSEVRGKIAPFVTYHSCRIRPNSLDYLKTAAHGRFWDNAAFPPRANTPRLSRRDRPFTH